MKLVKDRYFLLILFLVSLIIVFFWFRNGNFIASGEEGLWLFNPQRSLEHYSFGWVEIGTGFVVPSYIPRIPVLLFAILIAKFFPPWLSQATIYLLIISSGLVSMFYLAKELLGTKNKWVCLTISLFYFLNLYSMSQVWNRLIYSGMFAWCYLPVLFYLSIKWLRSGKFLFFVAILISSVLYSATFVTVAFLFAVWLPVGLYILYALWENRHNLRFSIQFLLRVALMLSAWVVVSLWWIYPCIKLSGTAFSAMSDWKMSFGSLVSVSQYFSTGEILLLRQKFVFGPGSLFYNFYSQTGIFILSCLALIITFVGWIKNRKEKSWGLLTTILLVGWFVCKGSNPPLGYGFYNFLFSNFNFTMIFRNPYEKLGLVLLLPYSVLFGLGLFSISKNLGRLKVLVISMIVFFICGVLVWPMWSGNVYSDGVRLNVPEYYTEANKIIDLDSLDARILVLPLINSEDAYYNWKYTGVVPTDFLFDNTLVNRPILNGIYFQKLYKFFQNKNKEELHKLFDQLNVGYIVIAYDLEKNKNDVQDSEELNSFVSSDSKMVFLAKVGELSIYKFKSDQVGRQIVAVGENTPDISYTEINPTTYEVNIVNANKPFDIILKNTYDKLWTAKIENKELNNHDIIYDYANKWTVDKKGSYRVKIYFKIWPWE